MDIKEFTYPEPANLDADRIGEKMIVNLGPNHPATHGVLRMKLELDGDLVLRCDPMVGYLHRGQEKLAENMNVLMDAVIKAKPTSAKGTYLRSVVVSSTMGPGIKVNGLKF